jgi:hypothetical protein
MDKQQEHYTLKQAMERLGIWSFNGFRQLERKYPEVFANINPGKDKIKDPWYDKAAIDKFTQTREID